jgi:3-dehydroquinate dehydratase
LSWHTLQKFPARHNELKPRLIVSSHDFKNRPDRLYNLIDDLNRSPSSINKIVWLARSIRDNIEAFELLQTRQKPTIALCMGESGLISRVLAKKFGAFSDICFASRRKRNRARANHDPRHETPVSLGRDRPGDQSLWRGCVPGEALDVACYSQRGV